MENFQQSRHALGSDVVLTLVLADATQEAAIFDLLWQQIEAFEQRFSRFRSDSELSRFNAAAGAEQTVSPEFHALLVAAKMYGKKTGGLYNPFTLPALQRAGYKGSWPAPHQVDGALNYEDRGNADWQAITLGRTTVQIPADTALDFGGIGKGYLLDRLGETLQIQHVGNYWLSLGGDILCIGHDASGEPWHIGVAHARQANQIAATVQNNGRKLAVATSGITKRQGVSAAGKWHHIIDPRTGRPADTDILTATVCTAEATTADVAAKCLVIAGSASAESTLTALDEANALLQIADGRSITMLKLGAVWN
jgi:thiamine biosynthesis lipoprotein